MLKEEKRRRMMDAAIDVFASSGFDAASMAEIASRAEVAKGTLYLYFASKEQLFEEVYQFCRAERLAMCGVDTAGISDSLEELCLRLRNGTRWEMAAPHKNRLLRLYLTHPLFSGNAEEVIEGLNTEAIAAVIRRGVDNGELRPLPIPLLEEMFIRFGSAVYYHLAKHPEQAEDEALWAQIFLSLRGCLGA